jgi:hypothetical protein
MFWLCRTCGVEHSTASGVCAICADERQWVPSEGQLWATLDQLVAEGMQSVVWDVEDGLAAIGSSPVLGIGQLGKLVCSDAGNVLWDPSGFVDDDAVAAVAGRGPVIAIVTSHPHMFGAQVEWSHRLGGVPVYVNAADADWVMRPDPVIQLWSDTLTLTPALTVVRVGGHFPGSSVACWADRRTVGFLRSYPNRLPLSAAVVQRMAATLAPLHFDRIYGLYTNAIDSDGHGVVQRSAQRHAAWVRGDYDHLT